MIGRAPPGIYEHAMLAALALRACLVYCAEKAVYVATGILAILRHPIAQRRYRSSRAFLSHPARTHARPHTYAAYAAYAAYACVRVCVRLDHGWGSTKE